MAITRAKLLNNGGLPARGTALGRHLAARKPTKAKPSRQQHHSSDKKGYGSMYCMGVIRFFVCGTLALCITQSSIGQQSQTPRPPAPEPVIITELPLPPTAPADSVGACTAIINPHRTGCVDPSPNNNQSGSFLPDGRHVLVYSRFTGAPAPPDPGSIYQGDQIILISTDSSRFPNGDSWKCVTCGALPQNSVGITPTRDYPQSFADGKRILTGTNIIDCSPYLLTDERCTGERVHIYPIRWNVRADGSGRGGNIRELRLHPDDMHLGFNAITVSDGNFDQFGYIGRLEFNPHPTTGEPLVPRYEVTHVTRLFQEGLDKRVLQIDPEHNDRLRVDYNAKEVGEFRGFSKNGREAFYVGYPFESSNIDLFAADLVTGKVRRLTGDPEYADPIDASPDDRWIVVEDTRGSGRQMFMAAMRDVPPITDLLTSGAVSSVRNNGERRFFQTFLIDRYGDRGSYDGQQLNAGDGRPGSPSDPNWNAKADPRWSPDGTRVAFWQSLVTSPACGGENPLPCPESTEPGGRRSRVMMALFTQREPLRSVPVPQSFSENVPWGTPYIAGSPTPHRSLIPQGTYSLSGKHSGSAVVIIKETENHRDISSISVTYHNYCDVSGKIINGTESVVRTKPTPTSNSLNWHSALVQSGDVQATKMTSPDGFKLTIDVMTNIFHATGTLTTTVNGHQYTQPANGN